jgi:hypothetical protein
MQVYTRGYQNVKDPVCFVIGNVTVCIPHLQKNKLYMYIIMQIKQFSNIEEYVKCVLQIFVHIIFNQ